MESTMKNTFISFAFLFASAVAFALGDITAAKSAANDISSALGQDSATGLPYLRVLVVNRSGAPIQSVTTSAAAAPSSHTVTLADGGAFPIDGMLTFASAVGRQCDLIVFQNGQSQVLPIDPSGRSLNNMRVAGTVSTSGNPFGYSCSVVLRYTAP